MAQDLSATTEPVDFAVDAETRVPEEADAAPPAHPGVGAAARPPAHYRLNRRAALILSGVFFGLGAVVAVVLWLHLDPGRRLHTLRASAQAYAAQEQWPQAAIQLRNVLQLTPDDSQTLYDLGTVYLKMVGGPLAARVAAENERDAADAESLRNAVACFQRLVDQDPVHQPGLRALLELQLRRGDWDDARRTAALLAATLPAGAPPSVEPTLSVAWRLLPTVHQAAAKRGRSAVAAEGDAALWTAAAAEIAPMAAAAPGDLAVVGPLAVLWQRLGRRAEAERLLDRAERVLGRCGTLWLERSRLAWDRGDDRGAEEAARQALVFPDSEQAARRFLADLGERKARTTLAAARSDEAVTASAHWGSLHPAGAIVGIPLVGAAAACLYQILCETTTPAGDFHRVASTDPDQGESR
ncbi:MAG: tetratricopeptide repeat protein [Planctomycetia bacterium]